MLYIATGAMAAAGAGSVAWPLISQMNPSADTIAAGAPVDVDLKAIPEGAIVTVKWRGKPIFVRHRTKKEIEEAQKAPLADLKDPQEDSKRVKKAEWLVVTGVCTHFGCIPLGAAGQRGEYDGWFCPCHGSVYDTSGRIRKGPAPANLPVPPYTFASDTKLTIG
jgi:ubiquinol-cytochrome c reductase iron-sulfur subunit